MNTKLIKKSIPTLGIVIPAYNEEAVLHLTIAKLEPIFQDLIAQHIILPDSFILFVDDGSKDDTWSIVDSLCNQNKSYKGIKLSQNYGHQKALLAGLLSAKNRADCIISMDADLQDDINLLHEFIDSYIEGYEIVYAVRKTRTKDTFLKRHTAALFYKFMNKLGVKLKQNHADYRLASKRVLDELEQFNEVNVFLRGLFPLLGFNSKEIYYNRQERAAGETKYPLKKMISFAIEGITSFSIIPLRLITTLGFIIFILSLLMSTYVLFESLFFNNVVRGWSSLALSLYMLSGIQLLSLGVIGEYVGKIYTETKRRPRFIIEKQLI